MSRAEAASYVIVALLLGGTVYAVSDGANNAYGVDPVVVAILVLAAVVLAVALTWCVMHWLHRRLMSGAQDHAPTRVVDQPAHDELSTSW
jgi:multisubunit Na+/H+ antiporter MnhC subunit